MKELKLKCYQLLKEGSKESLDEVDKLIPQLKELISGYDSDLAIIKSLLQTKK